MAIARAGTKVGSSDPLFLFGRGSDHKLSYNRDNRVIFLSSSYLWKCLPPRCWINLSWRCSRFQGLVCSTIKKLHDLSLQRREAAEFLSTLRYLNYGIEFDCTQGPQIRLLWCICCHFLASQSSYEPQDKSWMYIKFETLSLSEFIWTRCRLRRFRQHVFFP